ncbi:MAG: PHP domain-containing protein, partial [Thermodesulfobacteriota bacterium]
ASPCSSADVHDLIAEAKRIGLGGLCLTDHNHLWPAEAVEELRQRHGFLVLRGNEITTDQGDMLVFGLDKGIGNFMRLEDLRREVDAAGGFIILAHPFRGFLVVGLAQTGLTVDKAAERPLFRHVDALEVLNGKVTASENEFAARVAANLGLPATGGSDAHEVGEVGLYATSFEAEITDERSLVRALRGGRYEPIRFRRDAGR